MNIKMLAFFLLAIAPLALHAAEAESEDDIFNTGTFDSALTNSVSSNLANRLEFFPGLFFAMEASGSVRDTNDTNTPYGADTRFYGKAFLKLTRADIGSLYLAYTFNYFLFASAGNSYFRAFYQFQQPDPTELPLSLSEFHFSFDVSKAVFVRIGSQLISWGASYFWSPTDFINRQKSQAAVLSAFDVRSGKSGLRVHVPYPGGNFFLFADLSGLVDNYKATNLLDGAAVAWHADVVFLGLNIGTTGYAKNSQPFLLGFNATGSLLGFDIYGELALKFSNTASEYPRASLSAGFSRAFGSEQEWTFRAEFYYNQSGFGQTNISSLAAGEFTPFYSGMYYAYAELSTKKLFTSVLGSSLFGYANLADLSWSASVQLNFSLPGIVPFSVYARCYVGDADREFTSLFGGTAYQFGLRTAFEL